MKQKLVCMFLVTNCPDVVRMCGHLSVCPELIHLYIVVGFAGCQDFTETIWFGLAAKCGKSESLSIWGFDWISHRTWMVA